MIVSPPGVGSPSSDNVTRITHDVFACTDQEYFNRITVYAQQEDREAYSHAVYAGLVAGTCTSLNVGDEVFVMDARPFAGLVRLRRAREASEFWTVARAIQ